MHLFVPDCIKSVLSAQLLPNIGFLIPWGPIKVLYSRKLFICQLLFRYKRRRRNYCCRWSILLLLYDCLWLVGILTTLIRAACCPELDIIIKSRAIKGTKHKKDSISVRLKIIIVPRVKPLFSSQRRGKYQFVHLFEIGSIIIWWIFWTPKTANSTTTNHCLQLLSLPPAR